MKSSRIISTIILLSICCKCYCQTNSGNGFGITTHGTIRALIVFAERDYSQSCGNGDTYPANPEWLPGQLPNNAANI